MANVFASLALPGQQTLAVSAQLQLLLHGVPFYQPAVRVAPGRTFPAVALMQFGGLHQG